MAHKDPKDIVLKEGSHGRRFEDAAMPDKHGFSDAVPVSDFPKYYLPKFGNGSGWARDDGGLAKKYRLSKRKDEHGRIVSVQLTGWAEPSFDQSISQEVYDFYKGERCVVLMTSRNIEMDHKDGRKHAFKPVESCKEFQPMSKAVNDAKRTHCVRCKQTNQRFDAKLLGYPVSVISGTLDYRGSCVGCYWFDPKSFNQSLSGSEE